MKKLKQLAMVFTLALALSSCMTLTHVVGEGGQSAAMLQKRQWYILWGLVPLNEVNSKEMAAGASNYTITSQYTVVDFIITAITSIVTVNCQTVKVQK
jgi:hypothetical protein